MNCWGWATWKNRWIKFIKDTNAINPNWLLTNVDNEIRKEIDLGLNKSIHWSQIELNSKGIISTWAIFWYCFIYRKKGLCLTPTNSLVRNIGHDSSGENCGFNEEFNESKINSSYIKKYPKLLIEDLSALNQIRNYYIKTFSLQNRVKRKIKTKLNIISNKLKLIQTKYKKFSY